MRRRYSNSGSSSVYSFTFLIISGLGPTNVISPFNTFKSCGSSSILVLRRNLPGFVIRSSSFVTEWLSLFGFMVRSLYTSKRLPWMVALSCLKRTGPPSLSFTARLPRIQNGEDKIPSTSDRTISMLRFTILCSIVSAFTFLFSRYTSFNTYCSAFSSIISSISGLK